MNDFHFIPDEKHFQDIRANTIGASDIPIILGLSKYCTPNSLFRQKTGREEGFEGNIATKWGSRHEGAILASYIEETDSLVYAKSFLMDYIKNSEKRAKKYNPPTKYYPYTEFFHPELKWAIAHPDCININNEINIEGKSGRSFASYKRDGMDGFDKKDNTASGLPLKYYVQIMWQMFVSGIKKTVLRALIDTSDEMTFEIDYNKKIAEKLIEVASRFQWHIVNDKEPMPINKKDIEKMFPKTYDKTAYLIGSDSILATKMIERKKFLSKKSKMIKDEITDINDSLFVYIGSNKNLYNEDNQKLCTQVMFEKPETIIKAHQVRYIR